MSVVAAKLSEQSQGPEHMLDLWPMTVSGLAFGVWFVGFGVTMIWGAAA